MGAAKRTPLQGHQHSDAEQGSMWAAQDKGTPFFLKVKALPILSTGQNLLAFWQPSLRSFLSMKMLLYLATVSAVSYRYTRHYTPPWPSRHTYMHPCYGT
jgi:hypothetical protein